MPARATNRERPTRRTGSTSPSGRSAGGSRRSRRSWQLGTGGRRRARGPCRARRRQRARGGSPCRAAPASSRQRCRRARGVREPDDRGQRTARFARGPRRTGRRGPPGPAPPARTCPRHRKRAGGRGGGRGGDRRGASIPQFVQGVDEPHGVVVRAADHAPLLEHGLRSRHPDEARAQRADVAVHGDRRDHSCEHDQRHLGHARPRRQQPDDDDEGHEHPPHDVPHRYRSQYATASTAMATTPARPRRVADQYNAAPRRRITTPAQAQ